MRKGLCFLADGVYERKLRLEEQMRRTYLIQGLLRPTGKGPSPFSFGGGLRNGGLSNEAAVLLAEMFTFKYMGKAEYEFGVVAQAFAFIAEQARKKRFFFFNANLVISGEHRFVYYICPKSYESGVKEVIDRLLDDEKAMDLRLPCNLKEAVGPRRDDWENSPLSAVGWLEVDNGFLFFSDPEMFGRVKRFFGVK